MALRGRVGLRAIAILPLVACTVAQPSATPSHTRISRADFNRFAVRANLPVFWIEDANHNKTIDPDEVAALLFYPTTGRWVERGALTFTPAFEAAYNQIAALKRETGDITPLVPPPWYDAHHYARVHLVGDDLDQGTPTLVRTHVDENDAFVAHMLAAAKLVDRLFERQTGAVVYAALAAPDPESQSLLRRNRSASCIAHAEPLCSATPGPIKIPLDVYPDDVQRKDSFCVDIATHAEWLDPMTVVRGKTAVPYSLAYRDDTAALANELELAANALGEPDDNGVVEYLRSAAIAAQSNDWSRVEPRVGHWYVRIVPDDVSWDPCRHKAGFRLTLGRIDPASTRWETMLAPTERELELALAGTDLTFHIPDLIDVVLTAGADRKPTGAPTLDHSVAIMNMSPSLEDARARLVTVFDRESLELYAGPTVLMTLLRAGVRAPERAAGLGRVEEEIAALVLLARLRQSNVISEQDFVESFADDIVRQLERIAADTNIVTTLRGTDGNIGAMVLALLVDEGVLTWLSWDGDARAANGLDRGALAIHPDKVAQAAPLILSKIAAARSSPITTLALITRHVQSDAIVPWGAFAYRFHRIPQPSFVYSLTP